MDNKNTSKPSPVTIGQQWTLAHGLDAFREINKLWEELEKHYPAPTEAKPEPQRED